MGWMDRVGIRKNLTPAQTQDLQVSTAAALQQMTGGPFAPGTPLQPVAGIGGPAKAFNLPTGYNIKARPERGKTMSFEMLKALTTSYDIASMCISHRISSLRSLPYAIVPADDLEGNVREAVRLGYRAMAKPDGVHSFRTWMAMLLGDLFRYDAPVLYKRRDRLGRVIAFEVVAGDTIAPVLDENGRRPRGDAPAFVQYVNGQTYKWFKASDVVYEPFNPISDSAYGSPPLESVIMAANTDLRFQQHFMNYFTEGTVPEGFIILPEEASQAPQMKEFQEVFDSYMYGDMAAKRQLKVLPGGSQLEFSKDANFDSKFAEFLMKKVCAAYHVSPQELGFTMDVNKSNGDSQDDIRFRTGDLPVILHLQDILTDYLQNDLGLPVKFQFDAGKENEDKVLTAQADKLHIEAGVVSIDEIRELRYGLPTDADRRVPRILMTANGPVILGEILGEPGSIDPETAMPLRQLPSGGVIMPDAPIVPPAIGGSPASGSSPALPGGSHVAITQGSASAGVSKSLNTPQSLQEEFAQAVMATYERLRQDPESSVPGVQVAGAAVKADDTGRVLMIQRCLDPEDPAAGTWEFPGGHVEDGEHPQDAASREWEEETGMSWPSDARLVGTWETPDGVYAGYVYRIAEEASLPINTGGGEDNETVAWFALNQLPNTPLRPELAEDLPVDALSKAQDSGSAPTPGADAFDAALEAMLAAPKGVTATSWRDTPPAPVPQHTVDLALTDHYADQVKAALREFLTPEHVQQVLDARVEDSVLQGVEVALAQGATPQSLSIVMNEMVRDAYHAGDMAAKVQLGQDVPGWSIWAPGTPPEPEYADLGWEQALDQAGIRLKGIAKTTIRIIGRIIESGVQNGTAVPTLAGQIDDYLGDYSRAEMIAHTESARMISLATEQRYRAVGLQQWRWVISAGACVPCTQKSEKVHNLGEPIPPGHPRCRCSMSPVTSSLRTPL